jgi:hypothetical protein
MRVEVAHLKFLLKHHVVCPPREAIMPQVELPECVLIVRLGSLDQSYSSWSKGDHRRWSIQGCSP